MHMEGQDWKVCRMRRRSLLIHITCMADFILLNNRPIVFFCCCMKISRPNHKEIGHTRQTFQSEIQAGMAKE